MLKQVHALVLHGIDRDNAGKYRGVPVMITGSRYMPPQPYLIEKRMEGLFAFYDAKKTAMHAVQLAAGMHENLVTVHPFLDGNGRTARLIMNLILLRNGYPITVLSGEADPRLAYYRSLEEAQMPESGDNQVFQEFIAREVRNWLLRYLDIVSVDLTGHGKDKGYAFFKAIEPFLKRD